jgi:hypothetical protein
VLTGLFVITESVSNKSNDYAQTPLQISSVDKLIGLNS